MKNFVRSKRYKILLNVMIIISFILLSFFSYSILFSTHTLLGQPDLTFHLRRILELKEAILHKDFFPSLSFNQLPGSAVMTLYPYLNLYPIALLAIFIKSKIIIIYGWYISNIFLLFIISFYSSYFFNKSIKISYLFSILYGTSAAYFISATSDFGETTSYAVLPLVIFGAFSLITNNKYLELTLGFSLVIFCHVLSILMDLMFVALLFMVCINKLNKSKLISIAKSMCLTLLLTCMVWIPVIKLFLFDKTKLFTLSYFKVMLFNGSPIKATLQRGLNGTITFDINFFAILAIFISFISYRKLSYLLRRTLWLSIVFLWIESNKFPLKHMPKIIFDFFSKFQYLQRFAIIPQMLLVYLLAVIIINYSLKTKISTDITIFITTLLLLFNAHKIMRSYNKFYVAAFIVTLCAFIYLVIKKFSKHQAKSYLLMTCVILLAIFSQAFYQKQMLTQHTQQSIVLNSNHLVSQLKHHKKYLGSNYIITNNSQFKDLLKYSSTNYDYYPLASIKKTKLINRGIGSCGGKAVDFKHTGFDTFNFSLPKAHKRTVITPFMDYSTKPLNIYINHHLINHHVNKNNLIRINNLKKRNNTLQIKYSPNVYLVALKIMLFLLGVIWVVYLMIHTWKGRQNLWQLKQD